jgi:DNA repair photolyase
LAIVEKRVVLKELQGTEVELVFKEYGPKRILNVHKHVDGPWFWTKYSAHPYVGCRSGCEFCYLRGSRYLGRRDPDTFDTLIQVKTNAVELLRGELFAREPDVINAGDWQQPAEDRYRLSRGMLEVVLDYGFPLFVVERSPLLSRDLDLLGEINRKAWVGVVFSISSLVREQKAAFEPRSPGVKRRLGAMAELAGAGILVGTALMPILPFIGDDEAHLEDVVLATKDHGGTFVLGGGVTMDGTQAERTLEAFRRYDPDLVPRVREMYGWATTGEPTYGPPKAYTSGLGQRLRDHCQRHGLLDRIPRYIAPGLLAANKRVAERLFLRTYDLELDGAASREVWAYRKAAWTVDELPESVALLHAARGEAGLRELPGVGRSIAARIATWLERPEAEADSPQG